MTYHKSTDIPMSTFENAMQQFDQAAGLLGLDPGLLEVVKKPCRGPIKSWPARASTSSPIFSATPAVSPYPTSNGCRIASVISGRKMKSTGGLN